MLQKRGAVSAKIDDTRGVEAAINREHVILLGNDLLLEQYYVKWGKSISSSGVTAELR